MKVRVAFNNKSGELDAIVVTIPDDKDTSPAVAQAAIKLIKQVEDLYPGDEITVSEEES